MSLSSSTSDQTEKRSSSDIDKISLNSQETLNNSLIPYYNTKSILEEKRSRKRVIIIIKFLLEFKVRGG